MKKILLIAGIVAASLSANAQIMFSDCFKLTYEGKELKDGDEIVCSNRDEDGTYEMLIPLTNLQDTPRQVYAALSVTGNPSIKDIQEDFSWGTCQLCYESSEGNQCLGASFSNPNILGEGRVTVDGNSSITWDIHNYFSTIDAASFYSLVLIPQPIDEEEEIDDMIEITLKFDPRSTVTEIIDFDNNLPVEYFDLSGRKVANPEKGIYILRQGNKTTKRAIF